MSQLVVTGSVLIAVTYGLARFSLGLFVPELRVELGLSATEVGVIMGMSFAGYIGGLLLAGPLVGRLEARTVAGSAGLVAALGMAGVAVATGPFTLALAAGVGGVSTGLASPSLAALVETRVSLPGRPAAQSAINAGTSLGLIVAVPVAIAAGATWRAAWAAFACCALLASAALLRVVPQEEQPHVAGLARTRTGGLSWRLQASAVLLGLSSAAFWSFGREVLEVGSGLNPAVSRLAWVAVGAVGLLGALAGPLVRFVGLRTAVVRTGLLLAVSLGTLALGPGSVVIALGAAGLFGAGYMAMTGLLIVGSVAERPDAPAAAVATVFLVLAGGQVAGAPLAGSVADHLGLVASFGLAAAFAAAIAVTPPLPTTEHSVPGAIALSTYQHREAHGTSDAGRQQSCGTASKTMPEL